MTDATRLTDKVAIITGGAGGIGSATARLFCARGARVVVADIDAEKAVSLANELDEAVAFYVDLEDEQSIANLIRKTIDHFGRLDILHNNAAMLDPKLLIHDIDVERMTSDLWDRTYAVNVRGTMIACREALPHLRETRGCIVNMVSSLALQGHMIQAAYSSSKAAVIQLNRSIAASHGRYGVRSNAVAPGMTMTPALRDAFPSHLRTIVEGETLRDKLGEPEDIAEAVAFLASDAARNITGELLVCDGGNTSHVAGFNAFHEGLGINHVY